MTVSYDQSGDWFFADLKERGGDEDKIRQGLEIMGTVEIIEFRSSDEDCLLRFG